MKKLIYLSSVAVLIFLSSCSPSDAYQGKWKALDNGNNKLELTFSPSTLTIKDTANAETRYEYTQNSVQISNGVHSYGIRLGDGRKYIIKFPFADDFSKGLIMTEESLETFLTIGRDAYVTHDELYKLQK